MEAPKPLFCQFAEIEAKPNSKISFGYGCIIHPKAKIIVDEGCQLIFGEYNILEENITIRVSRGEEEKEQKEIYVGNYNHFKVGCYLENTNVENYNVFDYRCRVVNSLVETGSVITPLVEVRDALVKGKSVCLRENVVVNKSFSEEECRNRIVELQKVMYINLPKQNKIKEI